MWGAKFKYAESLSKMPQEMLPGGSSSSQGSRAEKRKSSVDRQDRQKQPKCNSLMEFLRETEFSVESNEKLEELLESGTNCSWSECGIEETKTCKKHRKNAARAQNESHMSQVSIFWVIITLSNWKSSEYLLSATFYPEKKFFDDHNDLKSLYKKFIALSGSDYKIISSADCSTKKFCNSIDDRDDFQQKWSKLS